MEIIYPFALCTRRGPDMEVRRSRYVDGGAATVREHAEPLTLRGVFDGRRFRDYKATLARICEACGGLNPAHHTLLANFSGLSWTLELCADHRLFAAS